MITDGADQDVALARLVSDGEQGLATLWKEFEDRLTMMVRLRLDHRLRGRVDSDDVLQEAYLEVSRRLDEYLQKPAVPVFVWMRRLTQQVMINVHRRHIGAQGRSIELEIQQHRPAMMATSADMARWLIANSSSPSNKAIGREMQEKLQQAFDGMDAIDREVLAMRHFEELSNTEVAHVLGLQKAAASNRYIRALSRLREIMKQYESQG